MKLGELEFCGTPVVSDEENSWSSLTVALIDWIVKVPLSDPLHLAKPFSPFRVVIFWEKHSVAKSQHLVLLSLSWFLD